MKRANEIAEKTFRNRRLPDTWDDETKQKIREVHTQCARELAPFIEAWKRLLADIERCEANDPKDFKDGHIPNGCPNEGYPRMIHGDPQHKERWFALMKEGYLVSKPFQRSRIHIGFIRAGGRRRNLSKADIPEDPRVLEPFVMRTYYFLDSLDERELADERRAVDEDGPSGARAS